MGNFFPMMVMGLFAVFWLSFGVLQLPTLGLSSPYTATGDPTGAASPQYNAVLALYLIVWGFALFTFFIFTLKINIVFALIFLFVSVAAWVLSGAYWKVASGDYVTAGHLQKVSPRALRIRESNTLTRDTGWRGVTIRGRRLRLVHVLHNHGRRNAYHAQAPCRRSQPLVAQNRRRTRGSRASSIKWFLRCVPCPKMNLVFCSDF